MTVIALTPRVGARTIPPDHNNPASWLRRGEVARLLGISNIAVAHATKSGGLHPITDARGDKLYDPDEVNAYAITHVRRRGARFMDDGELAAEAAKLFAAGAGRREAVMALRITYARVDELYLEWKRGDSYDAAIAAREQEHARSEQARAQARAERDRARRRLATYRMLRESLRGSGGGRDRGVRSR